MSTSMTVRRVGLRSTLALLSIGWLAVPSANQESDNIGFILFTSDRENPSPRGVCSNCEDIYVMSPEPDPDGTQATRLPFGGGAPTDLAAYNSGGADWSNSKELIAFQSNRLARVPQVFLMNPDGTDQRPLVILPRGAAFPSFSHTGNALCFHSQTMPSRDIYVVNVDGSRLTNLTSPGGLPGEDGVNGDNLRCDWSAKGDVLAFTSSRDSVGSVRNEEIYALKADGSGLTRLTDAPGADANPAWSPKGDRIAFESNRDTEPGALVQNPEIYVMDADGSNQVRLTFFGEEPNPSNINVTKPTWSPKGDRISFHRRVLGPGGPDTAGHLEVYTMNADGTNVTQITSTPQPGFSGFPSWGKWSAQP